jgi:hypothetical protein
MEATVLHGSIGERTEPPNGFGSGNAGRPRASKLKHAVEGMNCNGSFGRATPIRP